MYFDFSLLGNEKSTDPLPRHHHLIHPGYSRPGHHSCPDAVFQDAVPEPYLYGADQGQKIGDAGWNEKNPGKGRQEAGYQPATDISKRTATLTCCNKRIFIYGFLPNSLEFWCTGFYRIVTGKNGNYEMTDMGFCQMEWAWMLEWQRAEGKSMALNDALCNHRLVRL